jgi:glycosyltransferase involved in cell wall biosynthesis
MQISHPYRATILPVPPGEHRPLWSVMIPTYNCAHYLRETLASVLAQDPGPEVMQIEVVDDYSVQDDPESVVAALGAGRVNFYRQPANGGHVHNFNTCLRRARGHLVHILHGDDCVRTGFYRQMEKAFQERSEIGAAFCRYIWMDEEGRWQILSRLLQPCSGILNNGLERIASNQLIQTPAIVVRREAYETLGGYDSRISFCGEDWEMWVRIAAEYPIWYEVEPLAMYRTHAASLARRSTLTGQNIRDVRLAIEIYQSYLPKADVRKITSKARRRSSRWALKIAKQAAEKKHWQVFIVQVQEACRTSCSPQILIRVLVLMLRFLWQWSIAWADRISAAHCSRVEFKLWK